MNYAAIKYNDIANGPGVRTSLFVSGCDFHCPGCFNEVAWDYGYGKPLTASVINSLIESCDSAFISGLSLLGGEPFAERNRGRVYDLLSAFKLKLPWKSVWVYTGYLFEDLIGQEDCLRILRLADVLVDGPFIEAQKDIRLKFKGSHNQRIINLYPSLLLGKAKRSFMDEDNLSLSKISGL